MYDDEEMITFIFITHNKTVACAITKNLLYASSRAEHIVPVTSFTLITSPYVSTFGVRSIAGTNNMRGSSKENIQGYPNGWPPQESE